MPIDLTRGPIDPESSDYQTMLSNLQGNILKPHGRSHAVHIFLKFKESTAVRSWMRDFAKRYVTSARLQLWEAKNYREYGIPGKLFGNLFLSVTGYKRLGYLEEEIKDAFPVDQKERDQYRTILEFSKGMKAHAKDLNDPCPETWDKAYRDRIDAMILLADDDEGFMLRQARAVQDEVMAVADILAVEHGHVLRNDYNNPVEPFGYVDGISQPLFLQDEVKAEQTNNKPVWDPSAPLDLVLLCDPFAKTPTGEALPDCFGSYLVFRKLEQNLREFRKRIKLLAKTLQLQGSDDMAHALVLGRFKNGTPLALSACLGTSQTATNDFSYSQDQSGNKCPFHAHIRRLNPRGESGDDAEERRHRIARRSISYGLRSGRISDTSSIDTLPAQGVGTLFMCFQRSLTEQFGFLQRVWANSVDGIPKLAQLKIGRDPIIGRPAVNDQVTGQPRWPVQWGKPLFEKFDFHGFVTFKGGEFLFAPSLHFFESL